MSAGGTVGGAIGGGSADASDAINVASAADDVMSKLEDPKKMDALKKLYASFGS